MYIVTAAGRDVDSRKRRKVQVQTLTWQFNLVWVFVGVPIAAVGTSSTWLFPAF